MTTRPPYQRLRSQAGRLRRKLEQQLGQRGPTKQPATGDGPAPGADRVPRQTPDPAGAGVGHPPEVALERTYLGPVMDQAVLRAKRRFRIGVDSDYDLIQRNFDVLHYLLQAPHLIDDPDVDLIEHFLQRGRRDRLSPHPDFSMAEYLHRYPEKLAHGKVRNPFLYWLKTGKKLGDVAEPTPGILRMAPVLGTPPAELAQAAAERRRDLQERFLNGRLGEVFNRAAEIEPLIGATWTEIANPHLIPLSRRVVVDEACAMHEAQQMAGFRRARVVFVINRPRWGGGRRIEGHLAHALAGHIDPADIVVIYTDDTAATPAGRFPTGVREVDFASMVADLPSTAAQHALVMLLRSFCADAIVNINSGLLYRALRPYGRALMATERLYLCFLCNEQTAMGNWAGWSLGYFYRTFEHVAGVITDSNHLAEQLVDDYRVRDHHHDRLHVFRAPVNPELPLVTTSPARPGRRPQVFWAGRWDRQKRIPLALTVARLMPDVTFRMWGEAVMTGGALEHDVPDNVVLEGTYGHISEIPLDEADAWLYTSGWDGVPSQLLEVAMTGIPIVGSLVGGTGEVLSADQAWPVPQDEGPAAYVEAIRDVLADPADARRRAVELRERMLLERTEKAFAAQAADLLLVDRAEDGAR